jgi:hypothetical protein
MATVNNRVGFKTVLQLVDKQQRRLGSRLTLESRNQKAGGTDAEPSERHTAFIVERNSTSTECDRVNIKQCAHFFADVYAKLFRGLANDAQRLTELLFGIVTEGMACIARSLRKGYAYPLPLDPARASFQLRSPIVPSTSHMSARYRYRYLTRRRAH